MNGTNAHYLSNLEVADFDNDDKPDILAGKYFSTYLTFLKNNSLRSSISLTPDFYGNMIGSGSFAHVAVADFDGDGKTDVITDDYLFRNISTRVSGFSFSAQRNIGIGGR